MRSSSSEPSGAHPPFTATSTLNSFQLPTLRPPTPLGLGKLQVISTGTLLPALTAPLSTLSVNRPLAVNSGEGIISKDALPAPALPSPIVAQLTRIRRTWDLDPSATGAAPFPFAGVAFPASVYVEGSASAAKGVQIFQCYGGTRHSLQGDFFLDL